MWGLASLIEMVLSIDVVAVAGGFGAQFGYLGYRKGHIEFPFVVSADRTDCGSRLIHICSNHKLFLMCTVVFTDRNVNSPGHFHIFSASRLD